MCLDLDDAVVLVTGGARGVGAGIARVFLSAGATVLVCARRPPDVPVAVGERRAGFLPCDVRDPDAVRQLVADIVDRYGRLDVLVNNAGGAPFRLAADASADYHAKVVGLNLLAPLSVAQAANAVMQRQERGGAIVMVSSVSGSRPSPGSAAYGAAKAGLDSLATSLAVEWAPKVRVNSIVVGMVRTESSHLHYGSEAGVDAVAATVPMGRLADPEDVGNCAAFLASPLAGYVSGAVLRMHGGGERPAFLAAADANTEPASSAGRASTSQE
ncbi:SDR family oxidoreductase [Skermania piniformis]|uniref:SDR family oxidoreductase n=1 Tax=Skermania pinensis TaxID=39122 RepID=A0ABX8SDQ3_9ACTN|nr:SDR family oxidoreductase [Skermania piniformis]QXQ16019.1 SDR family oxidoreductase [Skermania piniformis]